MYAGEETSEIMRNTQQSIFVEGEDFVQLQIIVRSPEVEKIIVDKIEMQQIQRELDIRKAVGPNKVAELILKECWLHNIFRTSLKKGRCH